MVDFASCNIFAQSTLGFSLSFREVFYLMALRHLKKCMENKDAVETKSQTAASEQEVKTNQSTASETDDEAVISQLLDANKKLSEERENYRRGMLKAKGKSESVDDDDEDLDAKIDRKVNERLLNTQWAESQQQLANEAKRLARENKELKKSATNRSQISTTAQGSSVEGTKIPDSSLSPEKLAYLKTTLKWDDKKIEAFKKNRLGK